MKRIPVQPAVNLFEGIADPPAAIERSFSMLAFMVNRHLVDHMLRMTRELGLDFEALVIWGVLAHQNVAHLLPHGSVHLTYLDEDGLLGDEPGLRPLRLRDVTQITRFPRESVRRKLNRLRELGYVEETPAGWLIVRESVGAELRAFTQETIRRMIVTAGDMVTVLRQAEKAIAASDAVAAPPTLGRSGRGSPPS